MDVCFMDASDRSRRKKGISTFIATLLLIVLVVAAGVLIYSYTMGYLGGINAPRAAPPSRSRASQRSSTATDHILSTYTPRTSAPAW